jgi:hypothetical protein
LNRKGKKGAKRKEPPRKSAAVTLFRLCASSWFFFSLKRVIMRLPWVKARMGTGRPSFVFWMIRKKDKSMGKAKREKSPWGSFHIRWSGRTMNWKLPHVLIHCYSLPGCFIGIPGFPPILNGIDDLYIIF